MNQQLTRCAIRTDEDGHTYVIPYDMMSQFDSILDKAYQTDDYEDFCLVFSKYQLGGCISSIELYTKF